MIYCVLILVILMLLMICFCLVDKLEKSGKAYEELMEENERMRKEVRELRGYTEYQRRQIDILMDGEAAT